MVQEQDTHYFKSLYVTSKNFGGGIIFQKVNNKWTVWDMPPYLRKVLKNTKVEDIGKVLTEKRFKWEWI